MDEGPIRDESTSAAPDRPLRANGPAGLRVLVVTAHPRRDSLCAAMADAFAAGATAAGVETRRLVVADMAFDPHVRERSPNAQPCEPDVAAARRLVAWADHLVLVFPTWWGTTPALLKGFIDRVLTPGFAFLEHEDDTGWEPLLRGRSAHLITTMDTPPWVYRWIYGAPGLRGLARATLGFCGIAPVRETVFSPVKTSTDADRAAWLAEATRWGRRLADGVRTPGERARDRLATWMAAMRLQFYPMAWVAYGVGAAAAVAASGSFHAAAFWLGLLAIVLLEMLTVLANELVDLPSDRLNRNAGPFTGGTRLLVDGRLTPESMRRAMIVTAGLATAATLLVGLAAPGPGVMLAYLVLAVLAVGYTAPPLRLCWRGLGEIDVAVTHGILVVLCGWMAQGGGAGAPFPWEMSVPLMLSILPSIILSGVPDHAADRAVGKRTLTVLLGPRRVVLLAIALTVAAMAASVLWAAAGWAAGVYAATPWGAAPHAALIVWLLARHLRRDVLDGRCDGLMAATLLYIVWFSVLPLVALLER